MRRAEDWAKAFPAHTNNDDRIIERMVRKVQVDALQYAAEVAQGLLNQKVGNMVADRLKNEALQVLENRFG